MTRVNKDDHPHKLKRLKQGKEGKYIVFRCVKPGCTRTLHKDYVIGVEAECWACTKAFIMDKTTLQAKPTCGCTRKMGSKALPEILDDVKDTDSLRGLLESVELGDK